MIKNNKVLIIVLTLITSISIMGCTMKTKNNLDSWIGYYQYYEFLPPNINYGIDIVLYKDGEKYYAYIEALGFQTWEIIKAEVVGSETKIMFKFAEFEFYDSEPTGYEHKRKKGEVLFSFWYKGDELRTDWGTIKPIVIENQTDGKVLFEEVDKVHFSRDYRDTNNDNSSIQNESVSEGTDENLIPNISQKKRN